MRRGPIAITRCSTPGSSFAPARSCKSGRVHCAIFGLPDDLKFRSSMTLFAAVTQDGGSHSAQPSTAGAPGRWTRGPWR